MTAPTEFAGHTPEPWVGDSPHLSGSPGWFSDGHGTYLGCCFGNSGNGVSEATANANRDLILAAVNERPALLAEVAALRAQVAGLEAGRSEAVRMLTAIGLRAATERLTKADAADILSMAVVARDALEVGS